LGKIWAKFFERNFSANIILNLRNGQQKNGHVIKLLIDNPESGGAQSAAQQSDRLIDKRHNHQPPRASRLSWEMKSP
jgi:hypothetical protein